MAPYCWLVEVSLFVYLGAHKETDPESAFHVEMTSCGNEPERERDVYTFITLPFNKSSSFQTKIILPTSVQAFPQSCILLLVNQITFSSSFFPCFVSCRRDCF